MKIGTTFDATNKLGEKYRYTLIALNPAEPMREYILWNETRDHKTEVEAEWFNQREIKEVVK